MSKKVLIFTKKVLPRSNTFVAAQGVNLTSWHPVFIGFRNDTSGLNLIAGKETCIQKNHERFPVVSKLLLESVGHLSRGWKKHLSEKNGDVIHAHFGKGGFYCSAIARALDLPLITTFHGSDVTQNDKYSYRTKHRHKVFTESNRILAASDFIAKKLLQRGCPENKITQHYIGIDTDYFSSIGNKSDTPTILFVGRLIEQKGCQYLLHAMQRINQVLPEAALIIAGYGVYQKKLESLCETLKEKGLNNVTFVGAQNTQQVKALMDKAWVTCLPSIVMARGNEEGLSMVCLESQAMGTPVVAFDTGGVNEAVADKNTGLLVPEKNIAALTDALLSILQSNTLRSNLANAGIKRVKECFNIKTQCKSLESIYTSLTE